MFVINNRVCLKYNGLSHDLTYYLAFLHLEISLAQNPLKLLRINPLRIPIVLQRHDQPQQIFLIPLLLLLLNFLNPLIQQSQIFLNNPFGKAIKVPRLYSLDIELLLNLEGCQFYLSFVFRVDLFEGLEIRFGFF